MTKAIPEGYTSVTPYLVVEGAAKAIDFYTRAFGAAELYRLEMGGGKIGHAELQIGSGRIMLADESAESQAHSPKKFGGSPVSLVLYVEKVDAVFAAALAAGAKQLRPVEDQFYGDRSGMLTDPFGHTWSVATHVEDVSPEEMRRRMASMGS